MKQANIKDCLKLLGRNKPVSNGLPVLRELIYHGYNLESKINKIKDNMDKKMHKITEKMKLAEKDIKKGKKKEAVKVLKSASKKNEKLVKIDRDVRDPLIDKCKKTMKKGKRIATRGKK